MKSCKSQTQIERARDAAQAKRKGRVSDIETLVCCDIVLRQQKGMHKYGVTVANNPLSQREWLTHLYHELLDAAIYAKRQLVEPEKKGTNNETNQKTVGQNLPGVKSPGKQRRVRKNGSLPWQ